MSLLTDLESLGLTLEDDAKPLGRWPLTAPRWRTTV